MALACTALAERAYDMIVCLVISLVTLATFAQVCVADRFELW